MAKTLHIAVNDKVATYCQRDGVIVCGNSDYEIEFVFDSEWDSHPTKTARFIHGKTYEDVVFEGNTVAVPIMRGITSLSVGVFSGDLKTTTPALITCRKSILCDGGSPSAPTPDVYAQIIDLLNKGGGGGSTVVGATPVFEIDEVVTLEAGERAYVNIDSADPTKPRISFGIPQGADGIGKDGAYVTSIDEMGGDDTRTTYRMRFSDGTGYDFDVYHGKSGADGKDGLSAYEIWLANGHTGTEADFLASLRGGDGEDGGDGQDGADGVGIKSVVKTSTSGLVDTYTITLTNNTTTTFTVTNGEDGKDGKTPVNGTDYFTPEERADFKQEILAELDAAVYGFVDGNTINAKGNLAEGVTYTVYYELNGNLVKIGELTVGDEDAKTYTITWVNYDGTVLKTDVVTEGSLPTYTGATPTKPEDDSYTYAFSGWSPSVTEAMADVTYTAQYTKTEKPAEPTNWIPISTDTDGNIYGTNGIQKDTRLALTGGAAQTQAGYYTTGFIPVKSGDRVYIENVNITNHNWINMCFYKSDRSAITSGNSGTTLDYVFTSKGEQSGNGHLSKPLNTSLLAMITTDLAYIRVGSTSITSDSVIRIQRNGEWL